MMAWLPCSPRSPGPYSQSSLAELVDHDEQSGDATVPGPIELLLLQQRCSGKSSEVVSFLVSLRPTVDLRRVEGIAQTV